MFTTEVIWREQLTEEIRDILAQKADAMDPDSNLTITRFQDDNGHWNNQRLWSTQELAQEWVDFVAAYNPVSATIISNN